MSLSGDHPKHVDLQVTIEGDAKSMVFILEVSHLRASCPHWTRNYNNAEYILTSTASDVWQPSRGGSPNVLVVSLPV